MDTNHEAMLYGAIRILEDISNDNDVTLGDVNQAINDLYTIINEAAPNGGEADPMIFRFSDYYPAGGGGDFPRRAS